MAHHLYPFRPNPMGQPPEHVLEVVQELEKAMPRLRATQTSTGGLKRSALVDAVRDFVSIPEEEWEADPGPPPVASFADDELDLRSSAWRLAISVQAGRAWSNNGALLGLLAAAAAPDVDWYLAVVPRQYKGTEHLTNILVQVNGLRKARGIHLDLSGCVILAY